MRLTIAAVESCVFWKELLQLRNSGQQDLVNKVLCAFDPSLLNLKHNIESYVRAYKI